MRRGASTRDRRFLNGSRLTGALGILGGLACTASMTLAALGVLGAAAAQASAVTMRGMSSSPTVGPSPVAAAVFGLGPVVLVISAVLLALALGRRRRALIIPILAVGAGMYWGMYLQADLTLMVATGALGLLIWAALFLIAQRPATRSPSPASGR